MYFYFIFKKLLNTAIKTFLLTYLWRRLILEAEGNSHLFTELHTFTDLN